MRITTQAIDGLSSSEIERWNGLLAGMAEVRSTFLSHDFCKTVHDLRGGVRVIHFESPEGKEGFLPIQLKKGRSLFGHGEKVGGTMSDFFGIVGNLREPVDPDALLRCAGLSSLRFDHGVKDILPFAFGDVEESRGARVRVDDFEHFKSGLAASNKKFVQSVLSRERRLASELGEIRFRWQAEDPAVALKQLIDAKRNQYRRTGVPDIFATRWHRDLLQALLTVSSPQCTAIVSTLEAGGHWIGSKFSLICGDMLHSWFSVYDPQHRRHGPGHLVWFKTLEEGSRRGVRVFDLGEGEADYKSQYGGEGYTVFKGAIRRNSLRGHSERVLQAIEWRFAALKRRDANRGADRASGPADE
jgi:CelD/BcsL family acetyltransferase involved in cellulose biosynthesis